MTQSHRHTGVPEDGPRIEAKDLARLNHQVFYPAGLFEEANANVTLQNHYSYCAAVFTDAATGIASITFAIPEYKIRGISRIKIFFYNDNNNSDLSLKFDFSRGREDEALATDSLNYATYTTNATTNSIDAIEIPKSAYNSLFPIAPGDLIGLKLDRAGGAAGDTYGNDWAVLGLSVEFG